MRIDLHVHSSVSDGTDSPTLLVHKALAARLDVIALCDHDTFGGISEAREAGKRTGVSVVTGMEMSTQLDGRAVHLLAYGTTFSRELETELIKLRGGRKERIPRMVEQLTAADMPLTVDDVMAEVGESPSAGRPHVADAMVKKGYVASRKEAFDRYLGRGMVGYVSRYATPLPDAIDMIHRAHGVAVIAHPWGRGSRDVLSADVITQLTRDHGLEGIEVDHTDHDEHERELLFALGERLGLVRTGSSDYHGAGKPDNPLGCRLTRPSAYRDLVRKIRLRGGVAPA